MKKKKKELKIPTTQEIKKELNYEIYKFKYKNLLTNTISILIVVIAISIILATFFFPILEIKGSSMEPNIKQNDIVVSIKTNNIKNGDIIAFYYNNKILVKRVIAKSSDWVNIDKKGNVYVNNVLQKEEYLDKKSYGNIDISFPYQVPEESYFVLGDDRESSIDSRNSLIGCIKNEEIIGKIIFRIWPFKRINFIY